jgi:MFS family permease
MFKKYKSEINAILFAVISFDFMQSFWFSILRDNNIKLENIPLYFLLAKILRMIAGIPTGLLADKFGNKSTFYLARFSMLMSFAVLLIAQNSYTLFIALCFRALFQASFYGKVESYIYNYTAHKKRKDLFGKLVTAFYGIGDLIASIVGFISVIIFKKYGYDGLLICSLFGAILSIFLIKNIDISYFNRNEKIFFKEIVRKSYQAFRKDNHLLHLTLFFAVMNFFGWNASLIGTMILSDNKSGTVTIANFHNLTMLTMSFGCLCSWFISNKINLKQSSFLFMTLHLIFFVSVVASYGSNIAYLLLSFIFIYCTIEIAIERSMESSVDSKTRNTIISFANTVTSLIGIFGNLLISYFSKKFGIKFGITMWILIFLCYSLYNFKYFSKKS